MNRKNFKNHWWKNLKMRKDIQCSRIGRILLKCPYYAKWATDSMQSLSNPYSIFSQKQGENYKIPMEPQKIPNRESNLEKEQVEGIPVSDFKNTLHDKATVTKDYAVWLKKYIQANGTEQNREINPQIYGQLIFNKGVKNR